jgi:hypothetical protein
MTRASSEATADARAFVERVRGRVERELDALVPAESADPA